MTKLLRSFSTARPDEISEFVSVFSWFITGKLNNQVIITINCGELKIVMNQRVIDVVPLAAIVGVLRTNHVIVTADESHVFGFKLSYIDTWPRYSDTFSVRQKTNRDLWMNALANDLIPARQDAFDIFSLHLCLLKVTQVWTNAWVMVTESKRLVFYDETGVVADVDLRMMRSLEWDTATTLVMNHPKHILQFQIVDTRINWRQLVLNLANSVSDLDLETQKLSQRNVPIIVEKCLDYIFMHGITSEGIYRLSGVTSKVSKLLEEFAKNPFEVTINAGDYTVHDVASALRKFLRNLSKPVVGEIGPSFYATAAIANSQVRLEELKTLIALLPEIRFNTLRDIVRHLHFVQLHQSVNRMSIENLAIVWGKCLLGDVVGDQRDKIVLRDLITHKDTLFKLADDDMNHDMVYFKAVQSVVERL